MTYKYPLQLSLLHAYAGEHLRWSAKREELGRGYSQ